MNLWSISFAFRLGLGFHALNNEGADGSNLMQPRRIDVGNVTYDGISGEIIRHHILENFVNLCRVENIPMLPLSEALHPDRGPIGIRAAAKTLGVQELQTENLFQSVRKAIVLCAVLDVGGYLAAWKEQNEGDQGKGYVAEKRYIDSSCIAYKDAQPVKRETCFDVAWLISENPQDLSATQHSAFRDTFTMNSRYAQIMRSNIYSGIIRADLHRVGTDDYWYLQAGDAGEPTKNRLAVSEDERKKRQKALITAITNFIASPTGAKVAAWAPHVFLTEGTILLTRSRTAPFASPIKVDLENTDRPIQLDPTYVKRMRDLANEHDTWVWSFGDVKGLLDSATKILETLDGSHNG